MWLRLWSGPVNVASGAGSGLGSMLCCSIYCTLDIFGRQGDAEGIRRCRREGARPLPRIPEIGMLCCSIYCTLDIFGRQGDAEGIRRCRREGARPLPRIPEIGADAFGSPVRRRIMEISFG